MTFFKTTAVAVAIAMPSLAMAQATSTPSTTTAPAPAATMPAETMPAAVDWTDDAGITARLEQGGYSDVKISRDGNDLTIDAMKDGKPTNLVYDTTSGALTTVDGAGYSVGGPDPMSGAAGEAGDATTMGTSGSSDANTAPADAGGQDGNDSGNAPDAGATPGDRGESESSPGTTNPG